MPLAQATVSQHLKVLKEAGLIRGRIDGGNSCYCLDPRASLSCARRSTSSSAAYRRRLTALEPEKEINMRSEDEIRTLVRERYGAIAREGGSCCAPALRVRSGDGARWPQHDR